MKQLKEKIAKSGLKQKFIAAQVGISESHLTMMLNESGSACMSAELEAKINQLLDKHLILI